MALCGLPDSMAQQAHDLPDAPAKSHLLREGRIRRARDRDEPATGLEDAQRLVQRLLIESVQDDVTVPKRLFEVVLLVVDDDIRAQALHQVDVRAARGRRDPRAHVLGELDGDRSNASRARVDQDTFPAFELRLLYERLPGRQRNKRNRGRFFYAERFRLEGDVGMVDGNELGKGADSILAGPCVDLIARLESLHPGSDSEHHASRFIAQDERQWIGAVSKLLLQVMPDPIASRDGR